MDKLELYNNYLHALEEIKENGNKYGDEDIIKIYEEKLGIKEDKTDNK